MILKSFLQEKKLLRTIIDLYKGTDDKEIKEIVEYIKKNRKLTYFNYPWFALQPESIALEYDEGENRHYYVLNNKRIYFKKEWTEQRIKEYLSTLLPEQYEQSPHVYITKQEEKDHYNIVVDGGAAEGLFSAIVLERANVIYIIESDTDWVEALKMTFKDDLSKVHIVSKFLSDNNKGNNIMLDTLLEEQENIDLIKLDIEGEEVKALKGARNVISNNLHMCILACHIIIRKRKMI